MNITEKQNLWSYLRQTQKPILLYGMGNGANRLLTILEQKKIPVQGFFASDGFVRHQLFQGFTVCSYEEQKERFGDMIVLLAFGSAREEVLQNVRRISSEQELYAPDMPVYGEGLFTRDYLEMNWDRLTAIYEKLADDFSKKTFLAVLSYKISGKLSWLQSCEANILDTNREILCLTSRESYMDIGAYTGDTVEEFISFTGGANRIWAAEPDRRSFRKLVLNTEHVPGIVCFHGAVSDHNGFVDFCQKAGRGSAAGKGEPVPCVTAETLAAGEAVSFIKVDAEGSEKEVITGAKALLQREKPKLRVACYHRTEDLFAIPEQVFSMQSGYRLYMRKYRGFPAWDLDYYFI